MRGKDCFVQKKRLFLIRSLTAKASNQIAESPSTQTITLGRHCFVLSLLQNHFIAEEGSVYALKSWPPTLELRQLEEVLTELTRVLASRGVSALATWVSSRHALIHPLLALGFGIVGESSNYDVETLKSTWPLNDTLVEPLKPAIVMGRPNPNMLAQVRALGRCGVPVYCLLTRGEPESIARVSRYVRGVINRQKSSDNEIIAAFKQLREKLGTPPVLCFGGDYDITLVARIWGDISDLVVPVTDPVAASRFNDKALQAECVKQVGIPVPESTMLSVPGDLALIDKEITFPLICRPVELARRGGFAGKIIVVQDHAELERRLLPVLEKGGADILVQEYIPGGDDAIYFAMAACEANGEPGNLVVGRKLFEYPEGLMCIGETRATPDLEGLARASFKALGLKGVIGVEFKRDPRTGIYYYIEANLRPENFNAIAEASGVNIILSAYLLAMGKPSLYRAPLARPTTWRDFSLIVLSRLSGKRPSVLSNRRNPRVDAVWALDDPMPAMVWYAYKVWRVITGAASD